ncbi:MAG: hypothetical protein M1812_001230 [Candelaria pacifica]|nr:MAG: hypothetical protein M1812_001230 [Candelaria pacifica]
MTTLLTIPQELRDEIYTLVLSATLPLPSAASFATPREVYEQNFRQIRGGSCNRYTLLSLLINSTALLLINRQINNEVSSLISREKKAQKLVYLLDCVILNEKCIYPTWLSIPFLSDFIGKVYVDFRIDGRCEDYHGSAWTGGDGGPGDMVYSLFDLLQRFLERGPHFVGPQRQNKINVREFILNVVEWPQEVLASTDHDNEEHVAQRGWRRWRNRPADVAHQIRLWVCLLGSRSQSPEKYHINERVDRIKVLLDGNVVNVVNYKENIGPAHNRAALKHIRGIGWRGTQS